MGETWIIYRTCGERIEEIEGINTYRAIVHAIFNSTGPSLPGMLEKEYFFPDPSSYAAEVEAAPHVIETKAKMLGENIVEDAFSVRDGTAVSGTLHYNYAQIRDSLKQGLVKYNLDEHWNGSAAEQFTDVYLVELQGHLSRLAKLCNAHRDAAFAVKNRIAKAHDELVREVKRMVNSIVGSVGGGALVTGGTAIGGPVFGGIAAVGTLATIMGELVAFHSTLSTVVSALNDDLGGELLDAFDDLRAEEFKAAARGVGRNVSSYTWYPASEG